MVPFKLLDADLEQEQPRPQAEVPDAPSPLSGRPTRNVVAAAPASNRETLRPVTRSLQVRGGRLGATLHAAERHAAL